jgi:hypothetical protein
MNNIQPLKTLDPMSEDYISEYNIELFDTWIVKDETGKSWGPFKTDDLKSLAFDYEELFEHYYALNLATEKEKPFFQNTKFQRRKPKLVSLQGLQTTDKFYLLDKGVKKGPFKLDDIKELINSHKITLNILASVDKGNSWIKLFEHHEFDRRLLKNKEELPFSPNQEMLNKNFDKVENSYRKQKDEQDALVGLAFIGSGNDKGQKITKVISTSKDEVSKPTVSTSEPVIKKATPPQIKYIASAAVFILVLFTGINSYNSSYVKESSAPNNKVSEKSKGMTSTVQKRKFLKPSKVSQRKPAKVIKAKKYRPIKRKKVAESKDRRKNYRKVHSNERHETYDLDDPYLKEEVTRDIASSGNDDLSDEEIEFIERAERGELNDEEIQKRKEYLESKREEFEY